jgi:hypothetical protein
MIRKFNLMPFDNPAEPVVMYGIYNEDDYKFFETFEPNIIALWRGTDALVTNPARAARILKKTNCKHYAVSKDVQRSLARWDIKSEILPITSTDPRIKREGRGNWVYCYISSKSPVMAAKYKLNILHKLERDLRRKFVYTTLHGLPYEKLSQVYKKCFVGIRLLDHDGMSNSILEMGLMGRRTISNSGLPYTIPWTNYKSIRRAIEREFKHRMEDNSEISSAYRKLIDIGDAWLEY